MKNGIWIAHFFLLLFLAFHMSSNTFFHIILDMDVMEKKKWIKSRRLLKSEKNRTFSRRLKFLACVKPTLNIDPCSVDLPHCNSFILNSDLPGNAFVGGSPPPHTSSHSTKLMYIWQVCLLYAERCEIDINSLSNYVFHIVFITLM